MAWTLDPPDERINAALRSCSQQAAFDIFVEWLAKSQARLVLDSETVQDVQMYRNQGARRVLTDIATAVRHATKPQTHHS